jgi:DNA mismatch endonuclease (patch repair protein)
MRPGSRRRRDSGCVSARITWCGRLEAQIKVDVVFTRLRIAVFVDGCFWHGCPKHGNTPKANTHYWGPKLARNRERDARVTQALELDGWLVIRAWEHEPVLQVAERVAHALALRLGQIERQSAKDSTERR